jgi:hypothetical protein
MRPGTPSHRGYQFWHAGKCVDFTFKVVYKFVIEARVLARLKPKYTIYVQ